MVCSINSLWIALRLFLSRFTFKAVGEEGIALIDNQ